MKKLSIITPLYNTPRVYLTDVLNSVKEYTDQVELVLVNDSPNNIRLKAYLNNLDGSHVKVIHNPKNLGIFGAYYNGFLSASGEYCCILDHDDIFDPIHVLEAIDKRPDIIYTDEYKFEGRAYDKQMHKIYFQKPDFDILSTVFYLYTHHVTVLRTKIVRQQLIRYTTPGKYTSIFDIHYLLEYIKAFAGQPMNVCHVPESDYGWRIHGNSTASNLAQKPSGYFERLKKVEEFFRFFGETPLLSIDPQIGYLVDGEFFSLWDQIHYPLKLDMFTEQLEKKKKFEGPKLTILLEDGGYSSSDISHFFEMLKRIPANYLLRQSIFPLRIPKRKDMARVDPSNWKLQCFNVPFISKRQSTSPGMVIFETQRGFRNTLPVSTLLLKKTCDC